MKSGSAYYDDIHDNVLHWLCVLARRCHRKQGRLPVFYDIGAHKGFFSLALASYCETVVSFEPEERSYCKLSAAVAEYANITVLQCGLWNTDGKGKIYCYNDASFDSLARRSSADCAHYGLKECGSKTVLLHKLDTVVRQETLLPPDIIKIDVEGAERMVLQGAEETVREKQPFLIVEYSFENTRNFLYEREDLAADLRLAGYSLYGLRRKEDRRLHRSLLPRTTWNVLGIPGN